MKKTTNPIPLLLFTALALLVSLLVIPSAIPVLIFPWLLVVVEEKMKYRFHIPVGRFSKVVSVSWICLSTVEMFLCCFLIFIGNLIVLLISLLLYLLLSFLVLYGRYRRTRQ